MDGVAEEDLFVGHGRCVRGAHGHGRGYRVDAGGLHRGLRRRAAARRERVANVDELSGGKTDDQPGGRGAGHPALRVALRRGYGPGELRERDDPSRALERFEPSQDLSLLRGEPFGRKRFVRVVACVGVKAIEPPDKGGIAAATPRALGEMRMRGGLTALDGRRPDLGERAIVEMAAGHGPFESAKN